MAPKPGTKQGTKGKNQILEENAQTLKFYLYIIAGANLMAITDQLDLAVASFVTWLRNAAAYGTVYSEMAVYSLFTYFLFWDSFTTFYMILICLTSAIYMGCYRFMSTMAKPTRAEDGALLDGGIDLNMNQGMAEHMKDLILLTGGTQVLSLLSNYFWLFLLLGPGRAGYMLWVNILSPWFFAAAPEVDEKKAKKMERKMKRKT